MQYLKQVQIGIDYIEANLDYEIALSRVAKEASLSQWHFQRIFKALTNETLKTYIRSRRLALALDRLLTTDQRILDIAVAAGYESQESFARVFKETFGLTPNEYRKIGDNKLFLKKPVFDSAYLKHINKNVSLAPEIVRRPTMRAVGLRTRFYSVDSDKNNIADELPGLWDRFLPRLGEIENRVGDLCYGIVQPVDNDSDLLEYFAAAEVSEEATLPDGMESTIVPAADYATFSHRGAAKKVDSTVNYIYSSWLLRSGKRHTGGPDLEIYGTEYHPVSEESIIYYAIPIQ